MSLGRTAGFFALLICAAPVAGQSQLDTNPAFRPGSAPSGGRIGSVCNNEMLVRADQEECRKRMKAAKTPEERAEIRALVQEHLRAVQKDMDAYADRMGRTSPTGRSMR